MRFISLAIVGILLLTGCTSVKSEAFTPTNHDKIVQDVASSKLDEKEKAGVVAALMRHALGNYSLDGKTVGQVIDEQRKFAADDEARQLAQREAQAKEAARLALLQGAMRKALTVQVLSTHYQEADYMNGVSPGLLMKFQYHNTGAKSIKAFKGDVEFDNMFGDKLETSSLDVEDGLRAGETQTSTLQNAYGLQSIRYKPLSQMRVKWIPTSILFVDGTKLEADTTN